MIGSISKQHDLNLYITEQELTGLVSTPLLPLSGRAYNHNTQRISDVSLKVNALLSDSDASMSPGIAYPEISMALLEELQQKGWIWKLRFMGAMNKISIININRLKSGTGIPPEVLENSRWGHEALVSAYGQQLDIHQE